MDNAIYATLTRQSGLLKEMDVVANNIANANTTGYRREGVVFSEYITDPGDDTPALSMAWAHGRLTDTSQGSIESTGGTLDFAIGGEGFFQVQTSQGTQLTRAGSFAKSNEGLLVTQDGNPVLDAGGAPIALPEGDIALSADGTISSEGAPIAQIGVVTPTEGSQLIYAGGSRFAVEGETEPVEAPTLAQGRLETSNVDPITEVSRMVSVQRAYELGQSFLDREDERIRNVITTLGQ